jgi:UDP-N-acetylglucosamine 2-epimerase (non-hydrolysing)
MHRKAIVHIVGARPNFMKLAPVYEALKSYPEIKQFIIHTGQHYDHNMSDIFFEEFGIPGADVNLNISGTTVLEQIGYGIIKLGKELPAFRPDMVIIYGDINATAYASIVCSKLGICLAHIEAGLRSFDRNMPEETNRMIADALSNYYFTPSPDADKNLMKEGVPAEKIFFVGNVMIDTLTKFLPKAENADLPFTLPEEYALVTLHRPSNVDDVENLMDILMALEEIAKQCPIIFPMHPRTKGKIPASYFKQPSSVVLTEPLGYLQFLKLQRYAKFVLTDSGGIQEETTYLGVPCFTLRNNTERPITVEIGSNILVGTDLNNLRKHMRDFFDGKIKKASIPQLWDGKASNRIAKQVVDILSRNKMAC